MKAILMDSSRAAPIDQAAPASGVPHADVAGDADLTGGSRVSGRVEFKVESRFAGGSIDAQRCRSRRVILVSPQQKAAAVSAAVANQVFADGYLPASPAAEAARKRAAERAADAISPAAAATLTFLAKAIRARHVVEVGTGTGVSAVALLAGMTDDGVLTSIDNEAELQLVAREVLNDAGIPRPRARLIAGEALGVLPKLTDGAYDLVFVDSDPLEYVEYVAQASRLLRPGGILVLHHALWQGQVADADNSEDEPLIIREALEAVRESEEFTAALLPVGDGLLVATKG